MDSIDTNLLVRFYTDDDPAQADIAEALLTGDEPLFVPASVVLELVWVLSSTTNRLPKPRIIEVLRHLLAIPAVHVEGEQVMLAAVDAYERGLDFADALHLASSSHCGRLLTFDRKFATRAKRLKLSPPCFSP